MKDVILTSTDKYLTVSFISEKAKIVAQSDFTIKGISFTTLTNGIEDIHINVSNTNENSIQSYLISQGLEWETV